ncbi:MAG: HEAT repeat domain-containing protein [Acidobacteriota bacterium]
MSEPAVDSLTAQGRAFERRVGMLFELLGYRVETNRLIAGRQVDLYLEDRSGPLSRSYIVECKDQANPVNTSQYDAFRGRLSAGRNALSPKLRGIIVASVGFVKEAKAQALHEDIELLTISELESSVIDFRQYARDLIRRLEADPPLAHFVPPRMVREHLTLAEPAATTVAGWLADSEANQLTLLGDYGTGKTTFLKHLTLEMARRYEREVIEGGARGRVPVFIDLRDYTQALSLKQIILDLLDNHGIRAASYAAFEYVLREGQVLLILDGFDEMASRGNYRVTLRNFRELNRSALGRAKIILSCRSHYFTDQREVQRFLGRSALAGAAEVPVSYTDLYREIAGRPNFLISYLQEFEPDQVRAYLEHRCGSQADRVSGFIANTYNLEELSRRPVLLDMIVTSADRLGEQADPVTPVTPAILYRIYTDIWLSRNDWSTILEVETKRELLERFAAKAIHQESAQLHYSEIPRLIRSWRQGVNGLDEEEIDRELRAASFLVRDQGGHYRFSHRSFLEFFYARFLVSAAERGDFGVWAEAPFRSEIYRFVQDLLSMPAQREALHRLLGLVRDRSADLAARGHAIKCASRAQDPEVPAALLDVLRSDDDGRVRCFAATALGHHRRPEVVEALVAVAREPQEGFWVRTNSLLALVRLDLPEATGFLVHLLDASHGERDLWTPEASSILREVHASSNMELVEACLRYVRRRRNSSQIVTQGLELCAARPCAEGEALCREVLGSTQNLRLARLAFVALPLELRKEWLPRIIELLTTAPKGRDLPKDAEARNLVLALRGLCCSEVSDFLLALIDRSQAPRRWRLGKVRFSPLEQEALTVLAEDYPDLLARFAPDWLRQRRMRAFKVMLAQAYVRQHPADGMEILRSLFTPLQRPAHKRTLLGLAVQLYPESFPDFVRGIWPREPTTIIKKQILELLLQVAREPAIELMLTEAIRENRIGTRVSVCAILTAIHRQEATAALLERLRNDPSRWVRLQCLRSLAAPGRALDRRQVVEATRGEKDPDVLTLRQQLLGV